MQGNVQGMPGHLFCAKTAGDGCKLVKGEAFQGSILVIGAFGSIDLRMTKGLSDKETTVTWFAGSQ